MHTTSGWTSASHASTRGWRTRSELTFQVAIRTRLDPTSGGRGPGLAGSRRRQPSCASASAGAGAGAGVGVRGRRRRPSCASASPAACCGGLDGSAAAAGSGGRSVAFFARPLRRLLALDGLGLRPLRCAEAASPAGSGAFAGSAAASPPWPWPWPSSRVRLAGAGSTRSAGSAPSGAATGAASTSGRHGLLAARRLAGLAATGASTSAGSIPGTRQVDAPARGVEAHHHQVDRRAHLHDLAGAAGRGLAHEPQRHVAARLAQRRRRRRGWSTTRRRPAPASRRGAARRSRGTGAGR